MPRRRLRPAPSPDARTSRASRERRVGGRPPDRTQPSGARAVAGPVGSPGGVSSVPVTSELSELGRGLAALVDTVPVQAAEHLLRLVRHSLAAPPPGLLREARLGLLIDLLGARNGELLGTDVYETARAERLLRGENWPVYTTVLRAFGDWLHAQMAAIRLAYLGTQARAPRSMRHTGGRARYTKREVIEVFIRAATRLRRLDDERRIPRVR